MLFMLRSSTHRICSGVPSKTYKICRGVSSKPGLYTKDGKRVIGLVPGDGIGAEISDSVVRITKAFNVPIVWEHLNIFPVLEDGKTKIPSDAEKKIKELKIALKGPLQTPIGKGHASMNLTLRKTFNLHANLRSAVSIEGVNTPFKNVNTVVIRENTEGEYSGIEHVVADGIVQSIKLITENASRKCIDYAFKVARSTGRKKLLLVHKATIQRLSDGLFLEVGYKLSKKYPDVEFKTAFVDRVCLNLALNPEVYSDVVMVMTNLYGDIITDLCSGLIGGLGLTASGNIGDDVCIFESVHGSAPDIAGKGIANPTALIMSFILLLRHADLIEYANRIEKAVLQTISEKKRVTRDLGGTASCTEYTNEIISKANQ